MFIKFRLVAVFILFLISSWTFAASIDITAKYIPSQSKNSFTITTPQSGYCLIWPNQCPAGVVSVALPITTTLKRPITANDVPRNNPYFGLTNRERSFVVTNQSTGEKATITFRANAFSARYARTDNNLSWQGGSFAFAAPPCTDSGSWIGSDQWHHFLWKVSSTPGPCYKVSTVNRTEPSRFYDMSISFDLDTPDPLKMGAGVYTATVPLSVGPGGNIDFGDIYEASTNRLDINFTLTIDHELLVTTTPENRSITLRPCENGKVCTEEEGQANWERINATGKYMPLTGRSYFNISSTGDFTVWRQCGKYLGVECGLLSDKTAQEIPVNGWLTLPDNIVNADTGSRVTRMEIRTVKDEQSFRYHTQTTGQNRQGYIDIKVFEWDIEYMLKTRPDTYRGTMTIIFDPIL
ncbi:hypothetical protein ACQYRI_19795 [Salmonella enterica]